MIQETMQTSKQIPDIDALRSYCVSRGISYESYRKGLVTQLYPNECERIERLYETYRGHVDWSQEVSRWTYCITDGTIEYGYAFTLGHTMYLPIQYIRSLGEKDMVHLIFHELRHIW